MNELWIFFISLKNSRIFNFQEPVRFPFRCFGGSCSHCGGNFKLSNNTIRRSYLYNSKVFKYIVLVKTFTVSAGYLSISFTGSAVDILIFLSFRFLSFCFLFFVSFRFPFSFFTVYVLFLSYLFSSILFLILILSYLILSYSYLFFVFSLFFSSHFLYLELIF